MNHKTIAVAVSCLMTASAASAQSLSLKECMQYALDNSAKLKVQAADVDDAAIARRDAVLSVFTPSISAGTYAYSNFGRSVDPQTNTYVSTTSFNNGYSVSGSIVLFNGFEAVNNMKIAKTSLLMGMEGDRQLREEICLATIEAFCNVVYYKSLAEIVQEQVTTVGDALGFVRRQEELGQKGYADVVQIEADLADIEYQLITAQNNYASALLTLKDIMFWDPEEPLEIDSSDITEYEGVLVPEGSAEEVASVADYAVTYLPKTIIAKDKMLNAALELKTAKWKFTPYLSLGGGWSTSYYTYPGSDIHETDPFRSQFVNNGGEYIQLTLSFPIYDRLTKYSNLSRKRNAYRKASAEYDSAVREVRAEVERAVQDMEGSRSALNQADRRALAQEASWNMNRKKFEQGLLSPVDYRKASDNLLSAKAERLGALLKWRLKSSVVRYYNGISYLDQY